MRSTRSTLLAVLVCLSSPLCACDDDDDPGAQPSGGHSGDGDIGAANGGSDAAAPDDAGDESSAGDGGRGGGGAGGRAGDSGSSGGGGDQAGAGGSAGTGGSTGGWGGGGSGGRDWGGGGSGSAGSGGGGSGGGGSNPPACGDVGTPSNDLVVTVNGVEHDFSDAAVHFEYLGEGYHEISLRKGDVSVWVRATAPRVNDCPFERALPSAVTGAPWVTTKNTADNSTRSYGPYLTGAAGTFTMIGYHVITNPHRALGVAFSCDHCVLPEATTTVTGDSATIHGEAHLLNETP